MRRTKPIVSKDYVVGLTDGEGCFYVNIWKSSSYQVGAGVQMHFHIKMQEKDKALLYKIRNTLKCGNVYFQKENRANHTQCYRYTISAQRDILNKLIPFFQHNTLQSISKHKNFAIFCKIGELLQNKAHLTKEGLKRIRILKQKMNKKTVGLA
jgi:hypothetical protein